MQLATFSPPGYPVKRVGHVEGERVIDLNAAYARFRSDEDGIVGEAHLSTVADAGVPTDMVAFITNGDESLVNARRALDHVDGLGGSSTEDPLGRPVSYDEDDVTLHAPMPNPPGIALSWINTLELLDEAAENEDWDEKGDVPKTASVVWGNTEATIGPDDSIVIPRANLDHHVINEIELGVVVGKPAYQVGTDEAEDYIFGYTVTNDVSDVNVFRSDSIRYTLTQAKNYPTFWPIGPWIVPADEIEDPMDLEVNTVINGEPETTTSTSEYLRSPVEFVSEISQYMELRPGEIISMGGFPGCTEEYVYPGDVIENTIEDIGTLRNDVVEGDS